MTLRKALFSILGPRSALMIADDDHPEIVAAARRAVLDGAPLEVLMQALTGRGLAATPDFACVVQDEASTRLVVRGPYAARVGTEHGSTAFDEISGEGIATWVERQLPADVVIELFSGEHAVRIPPRDAEFPLDAAVVAEDLEADPVPVAAPPPPQSVVDGHTASGWNTTPPVPAAPDPTTSPVQVDEDPFRHMLEHTMHFGVEAAAVRPAGEAHEEVPPPPASEPVPVVAETPTPQFSTSSGLIDVVPPFGGSPAPQAPPARAPEASPAPAPSPAGNEDGLTISRAELLRLAGAAATPSSSSAPKVQAVHCPTGHSSAPMDDRCRSCGSAIVDRAVSWIPRPILGHVSFEDGFVHAVHRPVLLGRAPTAEAYTGGEEPQLLPLPDPDQMLSRTHAELRLVDWQVQVVDRGSLNGTVVTLPGREPQQLRPREPFLLTRGARVALGGVVAFVYEESET